MTSDTLHKEQQHRWIKVDWIVVITLMVITVVSRIPFQSQYLFEGDSVNFALGMERYDVSQYRPHPPGYILYIGVAKAFNSVTQDANVALVYTSIMFSAVGMLFLYKLALVMFNRKVALASSFMFLTAPFFWFYGEVALSYTAGACFSSMIAYCIYMVFVSDKKAHWMYASALLLGLAGGIRQDILMLLLPLFLYGMFKNWRGLRTALQVGALFLVGVLAWYVPMIMLSQGYEAYSRATSDQFEYYVAIFSVLFGNPVLQHFKMIKDFSLLTIGAAIIPLLYCGYYILFRRNTFIELFQKNQRTFLLTWILPPVLFFTIIYFHQPGYILIFLPAIFIAGGVLVVSTAEQLRNRSLRSYAVGIQLVVIMGIQTSLFFAKPLPNYDGAVGKPLEEKSWAEAGIAMTHTAFFRHTYGNITRTNMATSAFVQGIRSLRYDPNSVALLVFNRSPWAYGLALYYLPEFKGYFVADYRSGFEKLRHWHHHELNDETPGTLVRLNPSTQRVIIICSDDSPSALNLMKTHEMRKIQVQNGYSFFVIDEQPISIECQGLLFTTTVGS